jgi:hypothetical protein
MKSCICIITVILMTVWFCPAELSAQSGGTPGAFARMGFSPRGMSMGNSISAVHQDGIYAYYNPALAASQSEFIQLDLSSAALQFDRQLHMAGFHLELPPAAGFSLQLINARVTDIDGRDENGYHTGSLSSSEYQLTGNFGIRFTESFWGGIGLKFNLQKLHPEVPLNSSVGMDLGLLYSPANRLNLALTLQDLLATSAQNTADLYGLESSPESTINFPVRIKIGASYEITEKWLFSTEFEQRYQSFEELEITDRNLSQRVDVTTDSQFIRLGTRYLIHERITIRTGLQSKEIENRFNAQPAAGFSLHLPFDKFSPSIDYALLAEPSGQSTMHVFAIRLNL